MLFAISINIVFIKNKKMIKKLKISTIVDEKKNLRNHKRPLIGIYLIANPENEFYIGQSKNIKARFEEHRKVFKRDLVHTKLMESFKRFSFNAHRFIILEECSIEQLKIRERFYQELYNAKNSLNHQYN